MRHFQIDLAGRQNARAFVDFFGVEQVKHGQPLYVEDPVHAGDAEAALAVKKIGYMRLPKTGLLSQPQSGEFAALILCCNVRRRFSCRLLNFI